MYWKNLKDEKTEDVAKKISEQAKNGDGIFYQVYKYDSETKQMKWVWQHVTTYVGDSSCFNASSRKEYNEGYGRLEIKNINDSLKGFIRQYKAENVRIYVGRYKIK